MCIDTGKSEFEIYCDFAPLKQRIVSGKIICGSRSILDYIKDIRGNPRRQLIHALKVMMFKKRRE